MFDIILIFCQFLLPSGAQIQIWCARMLFVPVLKKVCLYSDENICYLLSGSKTLKGAFGRTKIPFHSTLTAVLCFALTFSSPRCEPISYCASTQLSTPFCYLCFSQANLEGAQAHKSVWGAAKKGEKCVQAAAKSK